MNNNVSCKVINDLLPLYALGECSEETKMLVKAHLDECEGCRAELGLYAEEPAAETALVDESKAISDFSAKLKRRNLLRTITATVLAVAVILGIAVLGIVPEFVVDFDDALVTVEKPVDGGLDITIGAGNYKRAYASCVKNDDLTMDVYITVVDNAFTKLLPDTDRSDNLVRIGNGICVSYNNGGNILFHVPADVEGFNIYYAEDLPGRVEFLADSGSADEINGVHLLWSDAE